ncbi:MAG: hypothetical protein Q8N96_03815 [Methylovulum sp.]|nr:hypothetical protein [Methylovulum sp.]
MHALLRLIKYLAAAKRAVEIAIETDEPTAIDFINEQTGEL